MICIKFDNVCVKTGMITPAPKVGEIVTVLDSYTDEDGDWLELEEYEEYDYEAKSFAELSDFKQITFEKILEQEEILLITN